MYEHIFLENEKERGRERERERGGSGRFFYFILNIRDILTLSVGLFILFWLTKRVSLINRGLNCLLKLCKPRTRYQDIYIELGSQNQTEHLVHKGLDPNHLQTRA